MIRIDKKLNLVVPVEDENGTFYVHAAPLSHVVFERYYKVLAKTFTVVVSNYSVVSGPRVALMALREVAEDAGMKEEVETGLIPEIRRSANMLVPGDQGWETVMFQQALDRKVLSEEDVSEVENALVFFTVYSAMLKRQQRMELLDGAAKMWGASITYSSVTEYAASLRTSTGRESSGAKGIHVSLEPSNGRR